MSKPLDELFAAFPRLTDDTSRMAIYVKYTSDIDPILLRHAVTRCIGDARDGFPPSVGELRHVAFEEALAFNDQPSPSMAFERVVTATQRIVWGEDFEWPANVPEWAREAYHEMSMGEMLNQRTPIGVTRKAFIDLCDAKLQGAFRAWDGTQARVLIGAPASQRQIA